MIEILIVVVVFVAVVVVVVVVAVFIVGERRRSCERPQRILVKCQSQVH